jgi:rubredoxin
MSDMIREFRRKPTEVKAVRWDGSTAAWEAIQALARQSRSDVGLTLHGAVLVFTLEGEMRAPQGSWIVLGHHGELYPVRGDVFADIWEELVERWQCAQCEAIDRLGSPPCQNCKGTRWRRVKVAIPV